MFALCVLVVSLLETAQARELELVEQALSCQRNCITFRQFAIPDRSVPERRDKSLLIHCRAGIGRTGLVTCCLLQSLGMKAEQAWALLSKARGVMIPDTEQQRKYAELLLSKVCARLQAKNSACVARRLAASHNAIRFEGLANRSPMHLCVLSKKLPRSVKL
jgi:Dual specificity phosphatase, catalytic domain